LNEIEGITVATVRAGVLADYEERVATVKVIPYAIPEEAVAQGEAGSEAGAIVSLDPIGRKSVAVVLVGSPGAQAGLEEGIGEAIRRRLEVWGCSVSEIVSVLPDEASLAVGTVLFRGRRVPVQRVCEDESLACFAGQCDRDLSGESSLRDTVEKILYRLAKVELPEATGRLAKVHGFNPGRVTIRNQRTRWGSCSSTGAISLNWRLIQVPAFVRDYVILHELIHLDHLNHSIRFWERLAKACPNLNAAEAWLKLHGNRIC